MVAGSTPRTIRLPLKDDAVDAIAGLDRAGRHVFVIRDRRGVLVVLCEGRRGASRIPTRGGCGVCAGLRVCGGEDAAGFVGRSGKGVRQDPLARTEIRLLVAPDSLDICGKIVA